MNAKIETEQELTVDDVISCMDKMYELVYIDYRDSLDNSMGELQDAIQHQDWTPLDESIEEWLWDAQDNGIDYILKELTNDVARTFDIDEDDVESFIDDNIDRIREEIYNRDKSNPIDDLLRNTNDPVCFYDTGLDIPELGFDEDGYIEYLDLIKDVLNVKTDKYNKDLMLMLEQASYGGRLVVYFREDARELMKIGDANIIRFKNPMIAIIDTYNGSGDNADLPGHEFTLPLNLENLFLDKTIKYNYTYEVCSMFESWCDCTIVKFEKSNNPGVIVTSSLHAEIGVEELYIKAYKAGGCTAGDMDMNRHRNTYYLNEFPCGTHCKDCGTFWID